jgi:hypothetical protein
VDPAQLAERLDAWIAGRLVSGYGVRPPVAKALVGQGWIVPILDGLDEMDSDDDPPVRAQAVVRALNHPTATGPRQFLLTSREHRYAQLDEVAQDTTVVRVQPLSIEQVAVWLTYRFPDHTKPPGIEHRWLKVLRQLDVDRTGPLATCLTSPLRLYLTITAYRDPATDPDELLTIPADELDEHLFSRLVPATVQAHPAYDADDVTRWLGTLTEHLDRDSPSSTDLNPFAISATASRYTRDPATVNRVTRILEATIAGLGLLSFTAPMWIGGSFWDNLSFWSGMCVVPFAGAVGWFVSASRIQFPTPFGRWRLDPAPLRSPGGQRRVAVRVLGRLALALVILGVVEVRVLIGIGRAPELTGAFIGAVGFLAVGTVTALSTLQRAVDRPGQLVRHAAVHDGIFVLTMIVGLAVGGLLVTGDVVRSATAGAVGLGVAAVVLLSTPWPGYLVGTLALARAGALPLRLSRFLDWAYMAGLFRLSGIAVQFRHIELQNWLTTKVQRS